MRKDHHRQFWIPSRLRKTLGERHESLGHNDHNWNASSFQLRAMGDNCRRATASGAQANNCHVQLLRHGVELKLRQYVTTLRMMNPLCDLAVQKVFYPA